MRVKAVKSFRGVEGKWKAGRTIRTVTAFRGRDLVEEGLVGAYDGEEEDTPEDNFAPLPGTRVVSPNAGGVVVTESAFEDEEEAKGASPITSARLTHEERLNAAPPAPDAASAQTSGQGPAAKPAQKPAAAPGERPKRGTRKAS